MFSIYLCECIRCRSQKGHVWVLSYPKQSRTVFYFNVATTIHLYCPILVALCSQFSPSCIVLAASSPMPARVERTTGERSQFRLSQTENMEIRRRRMDRCVSPLFQQAATVWLTNWLFEGPVPIPVRVYWRWFWSPPWGHSSGAAICHLDCMAVSLGGAPWLLIVYRLRCFRLHKGHMHRARWWAYTLIMSLYLCAGRSGTIRPPSGSPVLSAAMLFLHKYSPLLQLSLGYYNTYTHRPLVKNLTQPSSGHVTAVLIPLHTRTNTCFLILNNGKICHVAKC